MSNYKARLSNVKQHGAASSQSSISKDPYSGFRSVPEFHKASVDQLHKENSSKVSKLYKLQKKIAGTNIC
jgi:hypothetical protein